MSHAASPSSMLCHRIYCRVIYGDTDALGFAYNGNYLRWFEQGRTEMFRHLGLPYTAIEAGGIALPVAEAWCRFLSPVRYDDLLAIETRLDPAPKAAIRFEYTLFTEDPARPVARGYTRHACIDSTGRAVRPPAFLREFIRCKMAEAENTADFSGSSDP